MDKQQFIEYLTETLIPDLIESGCEATADDFKAAVLFLEGAEEVDYENGVRQVR